MNNIEYTYELFINKVNNELNGILVQKWTTFPSTPPFIPDEKSIKIEFDPLYIIGDIRHTKEPYTFKARRYIYDISKLSSDYSYEHCFGTPLHIENPKTYSSFIYELNDYIYVHRLCNIEHLEKIYNEYNINFICNVSLLSKCLILTQQNKTIYAGQKLEYHFGKNNSFITKETYLRKNHQFHYECFSVMDVIFCIYHFLTIHNYDLVPCPLCQKFYARPSNERKGLRSGCHRKENLNISYFLTDKRADRFSNSKGTCKEALEIVKDNFRARKKDIRKNISNNHNGLNDTDFCDLYDEYIKFIKTSSCYNNLRLLHILLSKKENDKLIWYIDDKKTFYTEFQKLKSKLKDL